MKGLAGLLLVFALVTQGKSSDDQDQLAALRSREKQYTNGVLHKSVEVLADVFAETFIDVGENGSIADKAQHLRNIANSNVQITKLQVSEPRIDLYGNTAVVTERFHVEYTINGKNGSENGRATDVWVKQRGRWMCVAAHSSRMD